MGTVCNVTKNSGLRIFPLLTSVQWFTFSKRLTCPIANTDHWDAEVRSIQQNVLHSLKISSRAQEAIFSTKFSRKKRWGHSRIPSVFRHSYPGEGSLRAVGLGTSSPARTTDARRQAMSGVAYGWRHHRNRTDTRPEPWGGEKLNSSTHPTHPKSPKMRNYGGNKTGP